MAQRKQLAAAKLPKFRNAEEAGAFWDTHSPEDYPSEFQEVQVRFTRPLIKRGLAVELSPETLTDLQSLAKERGADPAVLAQTWITERVKAERGRSA